MVYSEAERLHKYWGKKSFSEVTELIEHYSDPGDLLLDPFCGSGIFLAGSMQLGRNVIGCDINPIAVRLSRVITTRADLEAIEKAYQKVARNTFLQIHSLYKKKVGERTLEITHALWAGNSIYEIWCDDDGERVVLPGNFIDTDAAFQIGFEPQWIPEDMLLENSKINVPSGKAVKDLFTPRALAGLSLLLNEIEQIRSPKVREVMRIVFTGCLSQTSKMVFITKKKNARGADQAYVGSWTNGYWVPAEHFELNVVRCFERRYRSVISGLRQLNGPDGIFEGGGSCRIFQRAAQELPVGDESVDFVYMDPPHGGHVPYLEMSRMWNAWMRELPEEWMEREIVISAARDRKKNREDFERRMSEAFQEAYRTLKDGKRMALSYKETGKRVDKRMIRIAEEAGFILEQKMEMSHPGGSPLVKGMHGHIATEPVYIFRKDTAASAVSAEIDPPEEEKPEKQNMHSEPVEDTPRKQKKISIWKK